MKGPTGPCAYAVRAWGWQSSTTMRYDVSQTQTPAPAPTPSPVPTPGGPQRPANPPVPTPGNPPAPVTGNPQAPATQEAEGLMTQAKRVIAENPMIVAFAAGFLLSLLVCWFLQSRPVIEVFPPTYRPDAPLVNPFAPVIQRLDGHDKAIDELRKERVR